MKPLNLDNSPCSPISSNCVIWQGPDIACIKLCQGDTVSDVVYNLATELCAIMDTLNISNYDLSCFNLTSCAPTDFQALINFLIQQICELQNVTVVTDRSTGVGCPDTCIVTIADCLGGGTDTLTNYVQTIATKICDIVDQIAILQLEIDNLDVRVTALENAVPPSFTMPSFAPDCTIGSLPAGSQPINLILQSFINDVWCDFYEVTGSTTDLISAVNAICIADSDAQLFNPPNVFSDNPNWVQNAGYATVADAINNIWIVLCDVYNYAASLASTILAAAVVPTGGVMPWAGTGAIAPTGWAFCTGGALNRVTYSDLFAVIGTTYGIGDGVTTFNVPDLQQRIPVGQGSNSGGYLLSSLGDTGGSTTVSLTASQIPTHTHDLGGIPVNLTVSGTATGGSHDHTVEASVDEGVSGLPQGFELTEDNTAITYDATGNGWLSSGAHTHTVTGTATGNLSGSTGDGAPTLQGTAHGNMQPYVVMRYIIKL